MPWRSVAREFGTPLYVYSRAAMRDALAAYQRGAGRPRASGVLRDEGQLQLAVLQTFAQAGCGFDIVSGGELERVLAAGGLTRARGVLRRGQARPRCAGAGRRRALLQRRKRGRTGTLSGVASVDGPARAGQPARQPRRRRRHPPLHLHRPEGQQVRHRPRRGAGRYRLAASLPGLEVTGIDCHIGSQITQIAPYLDALDRLLDLVEAIEAEGIRIAHIDVGGGLGITYTDEAPPRRRRAGVAPARAHRRPRPRPRAVLLEPGRSLVGNAGVLLTEVLVLKPGSRKELLHRRRGDERPGAPGDVRGLDGHRALLLRDLPPRVWDVVGPVCESGDWLGRDRSLAVQPATTWPCCRPAPTAWRWPATTTPPARRRGDARRQPRAPDPRARDAATVRQ
jgi:diaminopimelate decarboxylase